MTSGSGSDGAAVRLLVEQVDQVGRVSGRRRWRDFLRAVSRGRFGRPRGWPVVPQLSRPWQDTISPERTGWRCRAANLHGQPVFAVDYQVCRRCRLGWVEMPHTEARYQRHGLAAAGLAALRAEHPGIAWHTLGGHFPDSRPFWSAIGRGVPGAYQQRDVCSHIPQG